MANTSSGGVPRRHVVGSDAFFRAIVESAVSPYIVIDASLTLLYASESIAELLGWEPQDWVGRSIVDLLGPVGPSMVATPRALLAVAQAPSAANGDGTASNPLAGAVRMERTPRNQTVGAIARETMKICTARSTMVR